MDARVPIVSPRAQHTPHAAQTDRNRDCWNARNAVRSGSPASRAAPAGSCHNGRRARCRSVPATSAWSKAGAPKPPNTIRPRATQWLGMLKAIAIERGYKPGWAAVNYKEKFGDWPPYGLVVATNSAHPPKFARGCAPG